MIRISKAAAEKFNEVVAKSNNPEKAMLRVIFGGYGWGGPRLDLTLDELKRDNDVVVESEGIKIVYETELRQFLANSVIDYSNSWFQRGFVIKGGNTSSC